MSVHRIVALVVAGVLAVMMIGCARRDPVDAHLEKAATLLYDKKVDAARSEIDAAIKLDPSRTSTYRSALNLALARKLPAEQARITEMMLDRIGERKLTPMPTRKEIVALHFQLGQINWDAKNLEKAQREFEAALALSPDDPQVLNQLGYFYAEVGIKLDQALKLTSRATQLQPDNGAIMDSYGWAQYKLGDYAAAVKTLKSAVKLEPDLADLRYHLGAAYAGAGMKTEAIIELNKALLLNRRSTEAAKLLRKLHK